MKVMDSEASHPGPAVRVALSHFQLAHNVMTATFLFFVLRLCALLFDSKFHTHVTQKCG